MHKTKKIILVGMFVVAILSFNAARAATLSFSSGASNASIGDTIDVSVRINSQGQTVNAAQGTIQYPSSILKVVSIDHSNSIFNVWAQEPSISTSTGEISFLGGSTNSFSGTSLYILDIKFIVRGSGLATLNFANAGVTAGDGTGANILDSSNPFSVTIGGGTVSLPVVPATTPANSVTTSSSTTTPAPVTRAPVIASGLPIIPVLRIPLYPKQGVWYNVVGDTMVLWDIPTDVTQVETRVSRIKDTAPGTIQKQLLTGQDIGLLGEGQWYVRARFKNNIGWSNYSYYSIQIDTTPPLPFTIGISSSSSDNPTPEMSFMTNDSLSGIKNYQIIVDGTPLLNTTSTTATLPVQKPGNHILVVQAFDFAGNSVESTASFETIPLASPQIVFTTPSAPQGEPIFISGTASPQNTVGISILDSKQQIVFNGTTATNDAGDWSMVVSQAIPQGSYVVSVVASDARGATSIPVKSNPIVVRDRVIFSIGGLDFSWFELFIIVLLLSIIIAITVAWMLSRRAQRRQAFRIIAERDVEKLIDLLASQLENAQKRFQGMSGKGAVASKTELGDFLDKMQDTVGKMKRYLGKEIEETK